MTVAAPPPRPVTKSATGAAASADGSRVRCGQGRVGYAAVSEWNYANVWEVVAEVLPDAPALVHGDLHRTWSAFDRRADALAAWLLGRGIGPGDTVAQYLYSCPEYLESVFAAFKLGLPPVNTNYRYAPDELAYLWDNGDCGAVVFHGEFSERVAAVRARVPKVRAWLWLDDGSGPCPEWATPFASAVAEHSGGRVVAPWGRSPDDLYLVYTGGTQNGGVDQVGIAWVNGDRDVVIALA